MAPTSTFSSGASTFGASPRPNDGRPGDERRLYDDEGFIANIARRFYSCAGRWDPEDLKQAGRIALWREREIHGEPSVNVAYMVVLNAMRKEMRGMASLIHISAPTQEKLNRDEQNALTEAARRAWRVDTLEAPGVAKARSERAEREMEDAETEVAISQMLSRLGDEHERRVADAVIHGRTLASAAREGGFSENRAGWYWRRARRRIRAFWMKRL